ncbi:MAG: hypothetical protein AB7G40_15685 [Hyphomonadaceae bacterium]
MTESQLAALLVDALNAAATREADAETALVSVNIDILAPAANGAIEVILQRKTRTLVFMKAEARNAAGEPIAAASSVHKLRTA